MFKPLTPSRIDDFAHVAFRGTEAVFKKADFKKVRGSLAVGRAGRPG